MGIEFVRPWAFWLLIPCAAFLWGVERRLPARRGLKQALARWARAALLALLVAALSGPALLLPGGQEATWALCDLSASAAGRQGDMEAALGQGLAAVEDGLSVGAIAFGRNAMVDAPLAKGRTGVALETAPDAGGTDIGAALALAQALLPEDAAGRIVLLSDGKDNGGAVAAQLTALAGRGIAVDVLRFDGGVARDAQVSAVRPPAQAYQGEKFDVLVQVDSTMDAKGELLLYANRQLAATREVTLRPGENTFIFQDTAQSSGVVTYEAQLVVQGDENPRNARLGAYMDVRGKPRVLVVGQGEELRAMLESAGMEVDTLLPAQLPPSAEALRQYHAVALVNVGYDALPAGAAAALDDYVRKLGRGLAVFGGDDSYALGGWRGTELEDMLPVTMDVPNWLDMPSLSLVLIIDKSGSMTEGRFGVTRLDMAKEAAMRAAEVLTPRDRVGVIAFDDTAKWVVPMGEVEDVAAIQEMIGTIRPGGGTLYYSSLAQAYDALARSDTQYRHAIFLTDGEPGDSGFEEIVRRMAQEGITLTTVAVGGGANLRLMTSLADLGGGRVYAAGEVDEIPKIFTKETYLAMQAYVQNRTVYPVVWAAGPLTDYAGFPSLDGYLAATPKPLATVALATDRDEPLLAWWQYGAGRAIAWTSDVNGGWTGGFLQWEEASAFFAGLIAHVLPAERGEGELALIRQGDEAVLRYTVPGGEDGLATEAVALAPDGTQQRIALSVVAPGVYEGVMDAGQEGAYAVRVEQRQEDSLLRTLESGLTVGYSAEYDLRTPGGEALLSEIAAATGGRVLTDPAELFTARGARVRARRDITAALLVAALVFFVLDAAQRRLAWERWLPAPRPKENEKAAPKQAAANVAGVNPGERAEPDRPQKADPGPGRQKPVTDTGEKLLASRKKKLM